MTTPSKPLGQFVLFDSLRPINNLLVKHGRVFLGWTSLAQGQQRSDAAEARTRGPSVSSQALYHWATALHTTGSIYYPNLTGTILTQPSAKKLKRVYPVKKLGSERAERKTLYYSPLKPLVKTQNKLAQMASGLASTKD